MLNPFSKKPFSYTWVKLNIIIKALILQVEVHGIETQVAVVKLRH